MDTRRSGQMLRYVRDGFAERTLARRFARYVAVFCAIAVTPAALSYARTLLAPNSPGWPLRSAEWLRDHGFATPLDWGEWCMYVLRNPARIARPRQRLSAFPPPTVVSVTTDSVRGGAPPRPIEPLIRPALPDEGKWRSIGQQVGQHPTLLVTYFRPDPKHTGVIVALARFAPGLLRFELIPGTRDPGGEWTSLGEVPPERRQRLLAAFNSGFSLQESNGGFYSEGRFARPLWIGAASVVITQEGTADIVAWDSHRRLSPEIRSVRQNLKLIVDAGRPVPGLEINAAGQWGSKLNQGLYCWRSGLGIDESGAITYAAGDGLTLQTLAEAMAWAGASRAMELDIHEEWVAFNVFQPNAIESDHPLSAKLLDDMHHPSERYLHPDDRDFFAAFIR